MEEEEQSDQQTEAAEEQNDHQPDSAQPEKAQTKPKVKMDEVMHYLFSGSIGTQIELVNHLFHTNYSPDNIKLVKTKTTFISSTMKKTQGDLFYRLIPIAPPETDSAPAQIHLEFQTHRDHDMLIRLGI